MTSPGDSHQPNRVLRSVTGLCPIAFSLLVLGLASVGIVEGAYAQDYEAGHGALQVWDEAGRAKAPAWVRGWLTFLTLTFATGLFFVRRRIEARWAVGGFLGVVAAAIGSQAFTDIVPLSGFLALLHLIFWSPALYVLLTRRPFMKERSAYAVWSATLTCVILFSFVFDIRDAAIYLDHVLGFGFFS